MTCFQDLNSLLQELSTTQKQLETLESFSSVLSTYEKLFSLIYQGMDYLSVKDQHCYILSIQPNGSVNKDALGHVVLQPFVPATQQ